MAFVTIDGEKREYGTDVRFLDIAREYQEKYEDDILLVSVDGKLKELHLSLIHICFCRSWGGSPPRRRLRRAWTCPWSGCGRS